MLFGFGGLRADRTIGLRQGSGSGIWYDHEESSELASNLLYSVLGSSLSLCEPKQFRPFGSLFSRVIDNRVLSPLLAVRLITKAVHTHDSGCAISFAR
mmetsp:Transcript_25888/g.44040  ORF Transcript_25888/g.44040 Transcript_25888/m.44040 type:complete len:98 (-) Transcript_25888:67-360(-)